ncbi:hypothetical protein KXW98_007169 [Aspergillus fumigatus]|nr:hypothetical protein CNMCM8689_003811 [Aspergillus fumigatus]KAH1276659.1 hypothetical protein KXX45_004696 [Aspergillus fumigatus]KAH1317575.1 hypothetical protein KXX66_005550 [Aspergillus fumigatus]KAH1326385.1 hypothetical protein KXX38_005970 [Aspergillus fumigatus]KAH1331407.1 hypothetical protein KXX47_004726 [Aspergillus fumigatus]
MVENKFIKVDRESFPYVFVKDVDISLKTHEKGLAQVDWPIPDTQYTKFFLTPKQTLLQISDMICRPPITFWYPTPSTLEITSHISLHLTVFCSRAKQESPPPYDIDLFVTLRKGMRTGSKSIHWDYGQSSSDHEGMATCRDTQGIGKILPQAPPDDRDPRVFDGLNPLELGKEDSWLLLPSFRLGKRAPVIV